jgi:hypothetical protein
MPIYGYQRAVVDPESGLLEMQEVTFNFSAADLRRVAAFLQHYAERMESGDWRSDHAHLRDFDPQWRPDHPESDLVVFHHQAGSA